jgi:hypothetical protein
MPYINQVSRDELKDGAKPDSAGELNYAITCLILQYLKTMGERYQTYNDILGALEGAKLELYRRRVAGYEDIKKNQNGEVFF